MSDEHAESYATDMIDLSDEVRSTVVEGQISGTRLLTVSEPTAATVIKTYDGPGLETVSVWSTEP